MSATRIILIEQSVKLERQQYFNNLIGQLHIVIFVIIERYVLNGLLL